MKLWREPFDAAKVATAPGQVTINTELCKGCGYCVDFCPRNVLKLGEEVNAKGYIYPRVEDAGKCLACGYCETICPEFAIKVTTPEKTGDS